jgi:hypothetical protein
MRKTFPLRVPGRADARVLDAIKHDLRKYVNRERRKTLPAGAARWEFECRVGAQATDATPCSVKDLSAAVDAVARTGSDAVYVEILARAAENAAGDDDALNAGAA